MTSWNAFQHDGCNGFLSAGYNARNGESCVVTTRLSTGRYIWSVPGPGSPSVNLFQLYGSTCFDSLGRIWSPISGDPLTPGIFDSSGVLLVTGTTQAQQIGDFSDAGLGRSVARLGSGVSTSLVCFNSSDASVRWSFSDADFEFSGPPMYVSGRVYAFYFDRAVALPGGAGFAYNTAAFDADTGSYLGSVDGGLRSVFPDGGLLVLDNLGDPFGPPGVWELNRYDPDLATVLWTTTQGATFLNAKADTDANGTTWFATSSSIISVTSAGAQASIANPVPLPPRTIAVDTCRPQPLMYLSVIDNGLPEVTGDERTLVAVNLTTGLASGDNGPSTLLGFPLKINGKWSVFT